MKAILTMRRANFNSCETNDRQSTTEHVIARQLESRLISSRVKKDTKIEQLVTKI